MKEEKKEERERPTLLTSPPRLKENKVLLHQGFKSLFSPRGRFEFISLPGGGRREEESHSLKAKRKKMKEFFIHARMLFFLGRSADA